MRQQARRALDLIKQLAVGQFCCEDDASKQLAVDVLMYIHVELLTTHVLVVATSLLQQLTEIRTLATGPDVECTARGVCTAWHNHGVRQCKSGPQQRNGLASFNLLWPSDDCLRCRITAACMYMHDCSR